MSHDQLQGLRNRLERELANALGAHRISSELVERLVRDLATIEQKLARHATAQ